MSPDALILGIDGGGAKTAAWLARVAPRDVNAAGFNVVGRGRAGPSNPQAVGVDAALAELRAAVDRAFRDAGLEPTRVAAAVAALAGSSRPEVQHALARWNERERIADRWSVAHDAAALLAAGAADGRGVALIAGAGSLAYGEDAAGKSARAGGWGYWLGDEGSAFAIGQAALRAVAAAVDGVGPPTSLTEAVSGALGIADPRELVPAIHGASSPRMKIASLAPHVVRSAASGDAAAQRILDNAAQQLAMLVQAVAARLDLDQRAFPLALGGGVLAGCDWLAKAAVARLQSAGLNPAPVTVVADPVLGSVVLARRFLA